MDKTTNELMNGILERLDILEEQVRTLLNGVTVKVKGSPVRTVVQPLTRNKKQPGFPDHTGVYRLNLTMLSFMSVLLVWNRRNSWTVRSLQTHVKNNYHLLRHTSTFGSYLTKLTKLGVVTRVGNNGQLVVYTLNRTAAEEYRLQLLKEVGDKKKKEKS